MTLGGQADFGNVHILTDAQIAALPEGEPVPRSSLPMAETKVITYRPASLPTGNAATGECIGSVLLARSDAWRCFTSRGIYEPCFSVPSTPDLACDVGPLDEGHGVRLHLTKALPAPQAWTPRAPEDGIYAVQLDDGTKCQFASNGPLAVYADDGQLLDSVRNYCPPRLSANVERALMKLAPGNAWTADKVLVRNVLNRGWLIEQTIPVNVAIIWR